MNQIRIYYIMLGIMCMVHSTKYALQKAFIRIPVADLVGEPIGNKKNYAAIPFGSSKNSLTICPRIHQALFNEQVTIVDETNAEYKIAIKNAFYITKKDNIPQTTYWTLKKNCMLCNNSAQEMVPIPLSYTQNINQSSKQIITLIKPWYDHHTNLLFSVGTRFIYMPEQSTAISYAIRYINPHNYIPITCLIPRTHCFLNNETQSDGKKRQAMIRLIRNWIGNHVDHCIPYVWGGCSYTHQYRMPYLEHHKKKGKEQYTTYTYPHRHNEKCHTGFDCSGVILRAAQCIDIPFFCKNSYTMEKKLTHIQEYNQIQPGDIIWIPGHVMIIADLNKNSIIEARGYVHGYGKLQEIPISEEFQHINTIKELMEAYHKKMPLYRLDKQGNTVNTIHHYAILKLF